MERAPASALTRALLVRKGAATPSPGDGEDGTGARDVVPHLVVLGRDAPAVAQRRRPGSGGRRRITLRLDAARHRRLRLAATHLGVSLQEVLIAALDSHLAGIAPGLAGGGCTCLAGAPLDEDAS